MPHINNNTIRLEDGEVGIFGFGSLLSVNSLEKTLGRRYQKPSLICTITGWKRRWNITEPNEHIYAVGATGRFFPDRILFLNIEPLPGQVLNGVLLFIKEKELPVLDHRESVYNRIDITDQINEITLERGSVYTYVGMAEHVDEQIDSPRKAAVQQSYLDTIEQALQLHGRSFRETYEASTEPVPEDLVIHDRVSR